MLRQLKKAVALLKSYLKLDPNNYRASYRVISIEKDENQDYLVSIQLIGKSVIYRVKPEELLADDKLVSSFSPTDIRNLTYLGYLGINAPKYKILAKRLSENTNQTLFALHKKGERKHQSITAQEISTNSEILSGLNQQDAHMIGFTVATEQPRIEEEQKKQLQQTLLQKKSNH